MALKVTYEHSGFPKGHEFDVTGLGLFENGKTKTLTKEQEEACAATTGMSVRDYLKGNDAFKVEGSSELKASDVETLASEGGEG